MCHRSPSTRDEHDRPPYEPTTVKAEKHWPHFVAADDGCCWNDGYHFHVRLPAPMGAAETWVGVSYDNAADHVAAYPGVPVEVGAFIDAAERHAEHSPELKQFRQLLKLLFMAAEVAMDMLNGHGRLCGCPLCLMFAAHDDRQPGLKAAIWNRVAELPGVLHPAASLFNNWVVIKDVPTAKPVRLTAERFEFESPASAMAHSDPPRRKPAKKALAGRPAARAKQLSPAATE